MKLESTRDIPLPPGEAWKVINDIDVLQRCIPGCERLERRDDGTLSATVLAKVGPVSAKFNGTVAFENVTEPINYRLVFSGQGGTAGFAKGHADVRLEPVEGGTRLHYLAEAAIGGKLAQIGSRLVEGTARKLSDDFFSKLESEARSASAVEVEVLTVPVPDRVEVQQDGTAGVAGDASRPSSKRWIWAVAGIAAAAAAASIFLIAR